VRITEILLTFWIIETVFVVVAKQPYSSAPRTAAWRAWQACITASNLSGSPNDLGISITL
jgi:hypothetical protein